MFPVHIIFDFQDISALADAGRIEPVAAVSPGHRTVPTAHHFPPEVVEFHCCNIIQKAGGIFKPVSIQTWEQDKIYEDAEVMLLIKTPTGNVKRLKAEVLALHPYEVPEFVVLKSTDVSSAYFGWAKKNTRFSR